MTHVLLTRMPTRLSHIGLVSYAVFMTVCAHLDDVDTLSLPAEPSASDDPFDTSPSPATTCSFGVTVAPFRDTAVIDWDLRDQDTGSVLAAKAVSGADSLDMDVEEVEVPLGGRLRFRVVENETARMFPDIFGFGGVYTLTLDGEKLIDGILAAEEYLNVTIDENACALTPAPQDATFDVDFLFDEIVPSILRKTVIAAAGRWQRVIRRGVPPKEIAVGSDTVLIDDILIEVRFDELDGEGNALAEAGPKGLRGFDDDVLPYYSVISIDRADFETFVQMELDIQMVYHEILTHEIAHALGFTDWFWSIGNILNGIEYLGRNALQQYKQLLVDSGSTSFNISYTPLENGGGSGTASSHWEESVFDNELMTGFIMAGEGNNPLSKVSIGAMADIGYVVDYDAADDFALPPADGSRLTNAARRSSDDYAVVGNVVLPRSTVHHGRGVGS